jgi:hypothetical protein
MPKIRWTDLPPSLRQYLFDRVADRVMSEYSTEPPSCPRLWENGKLGG